MSAEIVVEPQAERFEIEDPTAPQIGKWYWLSTKKPKTNNDEDEANESANEKQFVCVVRIGSNYIKLQSLGHKNHTSWRIHNDDFHDSCEWIPDPEAIITRETARHQQTVIALMQEIRDVTARLAITPGLSLPGTPQETQSLGLVLAKGQPATEYKTALTVAKKETLPELFGKVEAEHEKMAHWMSAPLIPLQANSDAMKPAIAAIEDRLFSVELYAGLCENVVQIRKGEPAPLQEKIRLFQRRAYMDEECLAQYETGGMDFKSLKEFDRWLCKPAQLARLLPFPRCVLAFQIRRNRKERTFDTISKYFAIQEAEKLDKLTFLYIRNGERVYRLNTEIDFDEELFPDMKPPEPGAQLYARRGGSSGWYIVNENELNAIKESESKRREEHKTKLKATPEKDRWHVRLDGPRLVAGEYEPFNHTNVYYDDITANIAHQMARHNRLVLVLQGILDRSEALHPHPPWSLWRQDSFQTAIELVYDNTRALTPGDRPDFEDYRHKLNRLFKIGDISLGQEHQWMQREAIKANENRRYDRLGYKPELYRPPGNPGPGKFAHVVALKGNKAIFQWSKRRRGHEYVEPSPDHPEVGCKYAATINTLFNVSAYRPGDFKIFFTDPRTRGEYIQWAPLLLGAEEFHAGNREIAPVRIPPPKKQRIPGGSYEYRQRKALQALVGKTAHLNRNIEMRNGAVNKKGTVWLIERALKTGLTVKQRTDDKDGVRRMVRRMRDISQYYFTIEEAT
jgi:hypothetical protein